MKKLVDWLKYIEQIHPESIVLGLDRVRAVASRLGILHCDFAVVTIGGTNGKGSCVSTIESIMIKSGFRVGAYTSPHLMHFNERIRIDNTEIDDDSLCQAFDLVEKAREDICLTYFEFTTLAALLIFQKADLDILLLEVGMGGRLDAVNIIEPDISIITTVSLDHTEWLGYSRESIGFEKAGIMRAGKPIICGDFLSPHSILEKARMLNCPIYLQNQDYHYCVEGEYWRWQCKDWVLDKLPQPHLPLQNVATALMAINLLRKDFDIDESVIEKCLLETTIPGRFQRHKHDFILDVAHNPAAAEWLTARLALVDIPGKLHAVVGMLADKDIENTFKPLKNIINDWHVCELDVKRAAPSKLLQEKLLNLGVTNCKSYDSVAHAIKQINAEKASNDIVLVFGSFHSVAKALQCLSIFPSPAWREKVSHSDG